MKAPSWLSRIARKLMNVFVSESMVGPTRRAPINRKERRAVASIIRKNQKGK